MSFVLTPVPSADDPSQVFGAVIDPSRVRLVLSGELDLAGVPDLLAQALEIVGRPTIDITVDLDALSFIDGSGLGALVRLANLQHAADATLTLERPGRRVRRTFALGGLSGMLPAAA